ncbi:hypothetical protein MUY14_05050 [Amycolatopsis sp. FBCC-B4732]|uniref:hypothetical protein n=1 Tax=Amycolatopsis sp. FBCC-B4732 TaxID=3079339 RepID=UPI001FF6DF70|nr:hypothetical protein [Amycolatopsis sp. FBCC-B4732]UOX90006.1 hypothetical protein MUY14_05050 [Amycolatopsis sp. FBCC-B4732]
MPRVSARPTLPEIDHQLHSAGERGADALFRRGEEVVRRLTDPAELRSLVEQVLADETRLARIAARSYYHANNFLKVVLMGGAGDTWKLRLHVWHPQPAGATLKQEDVHSHRWDFTTAIVLGKYHAREFGIAPGEEYHHYNYLPVGDSRSFSLVSRGPEQLRTVFDATLPMGTVYHLDHRVLHSISQADTEPVASVVMQGVPVRDATDVYRTTRIGDEPTTENAVHRPSSALLAKELVQFLSWI